MNVDFSSHKTQLVTTAIAASVATGAAFSAYNAYSRRTKRRNLNDDILKSISSKGSNFNFQKHASNSDEQHEEIALKPRTGAFDEDLIREQLARNYAFFGDEGMEKLRGGSVAVVGCGGVGSWAAVMLVRSCVTSTLKIWADTDCL